MGLVGLQLLGSGALAQPVGAPASPGPGQIPNSQRLSAPGPLPASPAAPLSPLAAPGAIPGPAEPVAPIPPLSEDAFQSLLKDDDLERLNLGCARILQEDNTPRLRLLQERLLQVRPAPQPLPVVLANAEVLLSCRAPYGALAVLDRYGPGPGAERVQWLLLQWRAATAALDHRRAALALDRLTAGTDRGLSQLTLPIRRRQDGTVVSRSAVEVLAGHLEARGWAQEAGLLLLRQGAPGVLGAQRMARAADLLRELPLAEQESILETALEQAAAAGAWSLVSDLLDAQSALPSSRAVARRLRLSPRLDDAYGEWRLRRCDPTSEGRRRELERQLRSPREPGGHSYTPPPPVAPAAPGGPASAGATAGPAPSAPFPGQSPAAPAPAPAPASADVQAPSPAEAPALAPAPAPEPECPPPPAAIVPPVGGALTEPAVAPQPLPTNPSPQVP